MSCSTLTQEKNNKCCHIGVHNN